MTSAKVHRNSKGVFYVRKYLGTNPITHKPIRKYREFPEAKDEQEAQTLADAWVGSLTNTGNPSVGLKLTDCLKLYIEHLEAFGSAPRTVDTYNSLVRCYIAPFVPNATPQTFTEHDATELYRLLLRKGKKDGKPLSRNTVRKLHSFLRGAFKWLKAENVIDVNYILGVNPPLADEHEARYLTEDEYKRLNTEIEKAFATDETDETAVTRRVAAFAAFLILRTGMRIGETCAVNAKQVNAKTKNIRVAKTASESKSKGFILKTPKRRSKRNIPVVDAVIERIELERLHLAKVMGIDAAKLTNYYLVSADGKCMRPTQLSTYFNGLRDAAGLDKDCTCHTLRHTYATFLIANGVDIRTVSELLGHADPALTMRIYAHVLPGRGINAAETLEDALDRL